MWLTLVLIETHSTLKNEINNKFLDILGWLREMLTAKINNTQATTSFSWINKGFSWIIWKPCHANSGAARHAKFIFDFTEITNMFKLKRERYVIFWALISIFQFSYAQNFHKIFKTACREAFKIACFCIWTTCLSCLCAFISPSDWRLNS